MSEEIKNMNFDNPQDPEIVKLYNRIREFEKKYSDEFTEKEKKAFRLARAVVIDKSWKKGEN